MQWRGSPLIERRPRHIIPSQTLPSSEIEFRQTGIEIWGKVPGRSQRISDSVATACRAAPDGARGEFRETSLDFGDREMALGRKRNIQPAIADSWLDLCGRVTDQGDLHQHFFTAAKGGATA